MKNLTMPEMFQDLARSALRQYPISAYTLEFLRHHENLTYRVHDTTIDASYVLRLHYPRLVGFQGLQQNKLAIESELRWVHALKQETDIPVQQPLVNLNQEFVTMLEAPFAKSPIPCSILSWVEGQSLSLDAPHGKVFAVKLGELTAKLHAQAQTWTPPHAFLRLSYDAQVLQKALADLQDGVQQGIVQADDAHWAIEAGKYIVTLLGTLDKRPHAWGMIHADLLSGNVLVHGETLIPIDFSLSGFGAYLFELGMCLCNLPKSLRKPYLQGYGPPMSAVQYHHIEACIIMIILISSTRHLTNKEWQAWFQRRFPVIAQTYCPMLLNQESFLFDME